MTESCPVFARLSKNYLPAQHRRTPREIQQIARCSLKQSTRCLTAYQSSCSEPRRSKENICQTIKWPCAYVFSFVGLVSPSREQSCRCFPKPPYSGELPLLAPAGT